MMTHSLPFLYTHTTPQVIKNVSSMTSYSLRSRGSTPESGSGSPELIPSRVVLEPPEKGQLHLMQKRRRGDGGAAGLFRKTTLAEAKILSSALDHDYYNEAGVYTVGQFVK